MISTAGAAGVSLSVFATADGSNVRHLFTGVPLPC
jgi:hypothetical protein